ncbi:MAG: hypothetical protein H6737_17310 [Alphaproteobacteria bacterium]|nr:hypothetical protein [Alphaproteobacteria bacterium]
MAGDPLDQLPLDVLLALRDAIADPSDQGRERAQQRAANAGFYLECLNEQSNAEAEGPPVKLAEPIAMEPAPEGVQAIELEFPRR